MTQRQDNIIADACEGIKQDCTSLNHKLTMLEKYLDMVVTELGNSRNQMEEILQSGVVPEGMANQLWSRLGAFDRCIQITYARQQSASERLIELRAHITTLLSFHDQARAEEAAFEAAALQFANTVLGEAQKHVE